MSVYFKFKNDLREQKIHLDDGIDIRVSDIKEEITRDLKILNFNLIVRNAQTNEAYSDDELIRKNTHLVIQRVPLSDEQKRIRRQEAALANSNDPSNIDNRSSTSEDSEEEKLNKMMSNSMYSRENWTKSLREPPTGAKPPPHIKCRRCLGNHWNKDCPFPDIKRTTGIPRSFLKPADESVPGAKINPKNGLILVNEMERKAYSEKKKDDFSWLYKDEDPTPVTSVKMTIPEELLCSICKELLCDAVMMPCCAMIVCYSCACDKIIESEDRKCPLCGEETNLGDLIPSQMFRRKVNTFCNQTGHSNPSSLSPIISLSKPIISLTKKSTSEAPPINISSKQLSKPEASCVSISTPSLTAKPALPDTQTPPNNLAENSASETPRSDSGSTGQVSSPVTVAMTPLLPVIDTSVPPPGFSSALPMAQLPPRPALPSVIKASEDPLALFDAAMERLDSKKSSRSLSQQDNLRSRTRDYYEGYNRGRGYSSRRQSPQRKVRSRRSPSPIKGGDYKRRRHWDLETEQGIITTNQSYIERMSVYFKFKNDLREANPSVLLKN